MDNVSLYHGIPTSVVDSNKGIKSKFEIKKHKIGYKNPKRDVKTRVSNFSNKHDRGGTRIKPLQRTGKVGIHSEFDDPRQIMSLIPGADTFSAFNPEFMANLDNISNDDPQNFAPMFGVGTHMKGMVDKLNNLNNFNPQLSYTGFGLGREVCNSVLKSANYSKLQQINELIGKHRHNNSLTNDVKEELRQLLQQMATIIPYGAQTSHLNNSDITRNYVPAPPENKQSVSQPGVNATGTQVTESILKIPGQVSIPDDPQNPPVIIDIPKGLTDGLLKSSRGYEDPYTVPPLPAKASKSDTESIKTAFRQLGAEPVDGRADWYKIPVNKSSDKYGERLLGDNGFEEEPSPEKGYQYFKFTGNRGYSSNAMGLKVVEEGLGLMAGALAL